MKRLLIAGVLLACAAQVGAVEQATPTPSEMLMLPPYCADRIDKGVSANSPWVAKLGRPNWLHIHHYCFALNFVNRAARARTKEDKSFAYHAAVNNFGYVIKAADRQFWMRPQIYVELGRVYLQQKKAGDASHWFNEAIQFNPAYEPAYLALIDLARQTNQTKAGLEVATFGLRHIPESSRLKAAYRELGGKEPYPQPIAKAIPPPEAVPATAAPDGPPSEHADPSGVADHAPVAQDGVPAAGAGEAPKAGSGSPTGCRFCPPQETQNRWRESFQKAPTN